MTLLAVSKRQPVAKIREAAAAGLRDFGENYLQEAVEKQQQLKDLPKLIWHFIGPIQSNKTRGISENFDWVHSVDRSKIARRLSEQRPLHSSRLTSVSRSIYPGRYEIWHHYGTGGGPLCAD